jgi:hypothetical protein
MTTLLLSLFLGQLVGPGGNYGIIEVCGPGGCTFVGDLQLNDDVNLVLGTGSDYMLRYDSGNTQAEFWSTDTNGAGLDGNVWVVANGTDDVLFNGTLVPGGASDRADSGVIALDNSDEICWESSPAGTDMCLDVSTTEALTFNGDITAEDATGPILRMYRNDNSPTNDDTAGEIFFRGYDDSTSTTHTYSTLFATTRDITDTDEDGRLILRVSNDGALVNAIDIDMDDTQERINTAVPLALDATDPADSGVLQLDNSDSVCWESSPAGDDKCLNVTTTEALTYGGDITAENATGSILRLFRDDNTPTANDTAGEIYFRGYDDSGSTTHTYATVYTTTRDITDTDEDGRMILRVSNNGSLANSIDIDMNDGVERVSIAHPIIVDATDQADSGAIRLDNNEAIMWEANPAGTDYGWVLNTSNQMSTAVTIVSTAGGLLANANIQAGGTYQIYWSGRTELFAPADGQVGIRQSDDSTGAVLDGLTAGTLTIKDQAGTGAGNLSFGGSLTKSGVVNAGDANYTTLATSYWITYQTTCTASRTVTLDDDHCVTGREIVVTDAGCGAAANNIIVDPEGTSSMNGTGSGTFSLTTDDESATFGCLDGSGGAGAKSWWVK